MITYYLNLLKNQITFVFILSLLFSCSSNKNSEEDQAIEQDTLTETALNMETETLIEEPVQEEVHETPKIKYHEIQGKAVVGIRLTREIVEQYKERYSGERGITAGEDVAIMEGEFSLKMKDLGIPYYAAESENLKFHGENETFDISYEISPSSLDTIFWTIILFNSKDKPKFTRITLATENLEKYINGETNTLRPLE